MRLGCGELCDDPAYGADLGPDIYTPDTPYTSTAGGYMTPFTPIQQIVPVFAPQIPQQLMPAPTTMTMPGMVNTAQLTSPDTTGAGTQLTPQNLLKPLPTIVDNQPTRIAQCNSFSEWVDQNPLLAGGILLALAWFTFGRK